MAPAADMFEMGVELQVLKKGTLFPMRAKRLYELYQAHDGLESLPAADRARLEQQVFRRSLEDVWQECVTYFSRRDPEQLARAAGSPKRRMALVFRWYLGMSSRWAVTGDEDRAADYQVWCGPAMGSFNDWVTGSYLKTPGNRRVADVAHHLMRGAAFHTRLAQLRTAGVHIPPTAADYRPVPLESPVADSRWGRDERPDPEELEERLGDPADDANPHGFAAAVARDERDAFPDALCAELVRSGFHLNYLPVTWGGTLESFDRSLTLVRTAARRDVAIMPGTMFSIIAATCLQLHGSPGQQRRAAEILRAGGAVAFALTEAAHGSDLLTNEVRLADGVLSGEKWMVGLGLRCDAVYVVARTGERGPGAFTAVLLETAGLPADRLERVPAPRTGGMRGIDLATLRFHDTPVPPDALVGKEGEGLEAAVKAQQTVRLMSMAGSLGIADTAVRLALDFATGRRVGRAVLTEAPHSRRELGVATAALIAADAVALSAARGVHVVPEAFSVWAPAAKHVVAEACDDLIRRGPRCSRPGRCCARGRRVEPACSRNCGATPTWYG